MKPERSDTILAEWPGQDGLIPFEITSLGDDRNGVPCVFFGDGSVIGAEATSDLVAPPDEFFTRFGYTDAQGFFEANGFNIWIVKGTLLGRVTRLNTWEVYDGIYSSDWFDD